MRLHLTLTIQGRNGSHQFVICDHDAGSLEEFTELLNATDHITVIELNTDRSTGELIAGAELTLNQQSIAKAQKFVPSRVGMR